MPDTQLRIEPGPDHPITIRPHPSHVTIHAGSTLVAETDAALELRESSYPAVLYIPFEDVKPEVVRPNDQHTYCPYKGQASYYDIVTDQTEEMEGAVWYYPDPYPAVSHIAGHVAFYADRVTITDHSAPDSR